MNRLVAIAKKTAGRVIAALVAICCFSFQASATSYPLSSLGARLWASGMERYSLLAYESEKSNDAAGTNGFRKKYRQWQNLPPEEKSRLRNRMNQYKQMPPQDRQQYRQKLEQWKKLPSEDRRQIQKSLKGWKDLTPEEKEAIRRRLGNR
jgi:Lon protease-like protein